MGFRPNTWAKIWQIERYENYTRVRLSISQKNKQTDEYRQTFGGYVSLVGGAHKKAESLQEGDRIHIVDCDVTNEWDKEKREEKTWFTIYSYDTGEQVNDNTKVKEEKKPAKSASETINQLIDEDTEEEAEVSEDDLPF